MSDSFLQVTNLKKYFAVREGLFSSVKSFVHAVDGVSFEIEKGKTLGLVGESGSGKTTVGRVLLGLLEATSGEVYFEGIKVFELKRKALRSLRKRMQIIFQDPYGSLNPRMTVGGMLGEVLSIHHLVRKNERRERIAELLYLVGLQPEHMNRYPHEFSGGQRQRIGIARALAVEPELIIADEPVSALDVSIQAQILNLLQDLQEKLKLTYLFIAHDLSVVKHISDEVAVMYLGKIVERAGCRELFSHPLHPYTQALLSAVPIPDPRRRKEHLMLRGDITSPIHLPRGCRFHNRCPQVMDRCKKEEPRLQKQGNNHTTACHLYQGNQMQTTDKRL
ncbi:MAG: dipeptide ABC transporter ATP-binding protein [Nitrospirae bacterium]|nr:dipeptide ABC transporter ATP-binding protein [Nitrospirota bacterium]